jgi:peptide/nickel transport system permease protein
MTMKQYIVRRLLLAVVTLIGVSLLIFLIMWVIPGDVAVAILGDGANPERVAALREQMGLNDSWYVQYGRWVKDIGSGNLGTSLFIANRPVKQLIVEHLPISVNLAVYTMTFAVIVGIALGTISGIWRDTWVDYLGRIFSIIGLSVPVFWLGVMILLTLVRVYAWTPQLVWVSPFDNLWANVQQMFWPAVTLGYFQVAFIARMTRSSLLEVLTEDYIRTARAKGLWERTVVIKHALRNVVIPIVTIGSIQFVALLGGVVVTERVFNLKGWGTLLVNGVINHDYPLVQTMIFIFAGVVVVANLLTDILYAWLDPRIHYL